ncbi:MAG: hypothetical protein JSR91_05470 [Proteobacteria bacterium]|nr:hypothetical protein [Pseudomonadota bacterium]
MLAIDFEASCLPWHGRSYPIEVGIANGDGTARSWLIRPAVQWERWTWTEEAEALHGLKRERLLAEGRSVGSVASELTRATAGYHLIADSELDDYWMRTLMAAAGFSQAPAVGHIVNLIGQLDLGEEEIRACVDLVDRQALPRHRAGADACWLAALVAALQRTAGSL